MYQSVVLNTVSKPVWSLGLYLRVHIIAVHLWATAVIVMAEILPGIQHSSLYVALGAKVISQMNV